LQTGEVMSCHETSNLAHIFYIGESMKNNKKTLDFSVTNIYNEQGKNFSVLLSQGIKKLDLYNLQKQSVIKQKEETTNAK